MNDRKSPSFQFYAKDWLANPNVSRMSEPEEACYLRLLLYSWIDGSLPADIDQIKLLCKNPTSLTSIVLDRFPLQDDGKRRNPRLEIERDKQDAYHEKQRNNSFKGVEARKHNHRSTTGSTIGQPPVNQRLTSSSSTSVNTPLPPNGGNGRTAQNLYDSYNGFPKNLGQTLPLHPLTTDPTAPDYNPKRDPLSAVFQPETQAESDSMIARLCADPIEDI
jgi:hypothetical protein